MNHQEDLIKNKDWDVLIVLDACRFDYFQEVYPEFLDGILKKVVSPASHTSEWCQEIFIKGSYKDVVYISANPYINSKVPVSGFDARDKFYKILDIWDYGWDPDLGTVPPQRVSKELKQAIHFYPKRRIIVHYLQPHAPYLNLGFGEFGNTIPSNDKRSLDWLIGRSLSWIERKIFLPLPLLRGTYLFRLALGIGVGPERETYAKRGLSGLRKGYEKNLRSALTSLSKLVTNSKLKGKNVIITSDHGELLGDDTRVSGGTKNRISHLTNSKNPLLREVPWFRIKRG